MTGAPGRVLVVTNDFPPRHGGIETYAHELVTRLPAGTVVVHAPRARGRGAARAARALDADLERRGVLVVRDAASLLLPTPALAARAARTARAHGCDRAWFVAAAPLALAAPALRAAGVRRVVASAHGHEVWWASLPGSRALLRRVDERVDVLTAVARVPADRIAGALAAGAPPPVLLPPGVDAAAFAPGADGAGVLAAHGLTGRPVVVCVSRLVARKGQDVLVAAMPLVRERVPGAALLLVGAGPRRRSLVRAARRAGLAVGAGGDVVLTGPVAQGRLAAHYAAGDVFAMPARDRRGGLEVEGLGICYLEAAACGLPVVAGRSGGTAEAVADGSTGVLVDGRDRRAVAEAITGLLLDPTRSAALGRAGRTRVAGGWSWERRAARLAELLDPERPLTPPVAR